MGKNVFIHFVRRVNLSSISLSYRCASVLTYSRCASLSVTLAFCLFKQIKRYKRSAWFKIPFLKTEREKEMSICLQKQTAPCHGAAFVSSASIQVEHMLELYILLVAFTQCISLIIDH